MQRSGRKSSWFAQADQEIRKVAGDANGCLLEQLLQQTGYHDTACVKLLREGRMLLQVRVSAFAIVCLGAGLCMVGELERSGVGTPVDTDAHEIEKSLSNLRAQTPFVV